MHAKPLSVRGLPRSDGTFTHSSTVRRLIKNLWGSKSEGVYYIYELFNFPAEGGYTVTDIDAFLTHKNIQIVYILVAITVEDSLSPLTRRV